MFYCYDFKKLEEKEFKNMAQMSRHSNIGLSRICKYFKAKNINDEFKLTEKRYFFNNEKIKAAEKVKGYNLYVELNFDIETEQWRAFKDTKYDISSLGRIRKITKNGYRYYKPYVSLKGKNKNIKRLNCKIQSKEYKVSDLIKHCFFTEEIGVVYYLNGNNLDNRVENIEIISRVEHGKRTGGRSKSKEVCKIDLKSKKILDVYKSVREAGRENFCSYQTILDNINKVYKNSTFGENISFKYLDNIDIDEQGVVV